MLVLTRKKSEMIQIGDDIVIKVIYTGKNTVKIGVAAPRDVRVLRAELLEPLPAGHPLGSYLEQRRLAGLAAGEGADDEGRAPVVRVRPR